MNALSHLANYTDDEDDSSDSHEEQHDNKTTVKVQPVNTSRAQTKSPERQPPPTVAKKAPPPPAPASPAAPKERPLDIRKSQQLLSEIPSIHRRRALLTPKPIEGVANFGIPPESDKPCDPERAEKIAHFLSLRASGHRLNDHLQRNKAFRNPRIYAKLVEFIDLNETGSNFDKRDFDPEGFPPEAYIDQILETQKRIAEEKALAQQNRSSIPFVKEQSATLAAAMATAAKVASRIAIPQGDSSADRKRRQTSSDTTSSSSSSRWDSTTDHNRKRRH